jgi:outer membrane protein TolC
MGIYQDDGAQHPISRRVALTTVQLLEGRTVRSGSVAARRGDLVLSAEVLDRLDLSLPFDVLADAEVVGWDDQFPTVSLQSQLAVAFENSPELASMRARVAGENTGVAGARASWLPQVEAQASASQLDQAAASAFQPPTNVTAKVTASQVLWSDGAATNVRVQGDLRTGRAAELVAAEQDLAHDISVAFVNVERARAVIAVRAADMDRARLSLQVANQRARIGDGAQSEVNRWEAEVANARAALVANWADFRAAMVNLNLLCGVEPERMIVPEPNGLTVGEEFASRLNNPRKLDRLAGLAADVGVERAPELDQLTSALQAQNRLKRLTDRAYAMPTVALQGGVNFNIYQTESDPIEIPGLGPIELATFPAAYWNVGAVASIPLFSGGQRRADQVKAGHDVASLEYQRRQIELAIRARAVTAVNQAHSAAWQAELRQDAAEAALKNLDAALSAYAAGSATQTTVTEARTNALQVQLAATDARFATTLRLLDLLRAGASLPTPAAPDGPTTMRSILIDRLESAP